MSSATPDWAALAEAREQEVRRRRLLRIGGGVLAVVVVGALTAGALVLTRPSGTPAATPGATASAPPASADEATGGPATLPGMVLGGSTSLGRSEGHSGPTMVLHGTSTGWADSQAPLVDTTRSFTVSAMVRNDAPTGGRAVVTQGTDTYYSFYLGRDYWGSRNQWVFKVQSAAGAQDGTTFQAFSTSPATTGRWTLLTGVYDAAEKKITLYVDGVPQQTTRVSGIWQTTGGLQFGRVRYKSQWTDFWNGAISNVQIWDQALPAEAVDALKGSGGADSGTAAEHSWLLP
ncbi:LamG domain-containing protein [Kitasatospora sp. NPDC057198]|uniref:LamG domain-containing protein n=1 Tax=Kitasatospora sp. NPDC057198 TaxID=3346046 RepID=UPI00363AAEF8